MSEPFAIPRKVLIFVIVIPLAALVGYFLATPLEFTSFTFVGLVLLGLSIPILLRWHHALLILSWNATINVFILPGQPDLWMLVAGVSLGLSILNRLLMKKEISAYVPALVWPLVFLTLVVLVTAKLTGGIGVRSLGGSTYGGKRYVYVLTAIIGFFALASQRVPPNRAKLYAGAFFLSALTAMVSNLAYLGGRDFYFLYYVFPVAFAMQQALAEFSVAGAVMRLNGLALAAPAVSYFMFLRYGIQGLMSKPWRLAVLLAAVFTGMLGGFRSTIVMFGLLFAILFYFEGLFRTRLLLVALITMVLCGAALIPMAKKLPLSVQRSLSVLPIEIDSQAKYDAQGTTEWRLRMWDLLLPEVPKYFWVGKGFAVNPTELYLMTEAYMRGMAQDVELSIIGGSYHSGPLTLIIAFGVFGVIGFLWFAGAALWVLHRNYRFGPPELKHVNTFLLSYFLMRLIYFLVFYGQFAEDLAVFTGAIGLSVSLNGGVRKPEELPVSLEAVPEPVPA